MDSVIKYIDKDAIHEKDSGGGGGERGNKEIEQENLLFHNINQTVIGLNGITIHFSQNITCKLNSFNIYSQRLIQSNDSNQ